MRGETCIAIATFFTSVSLILLIFAHVAQINTSVVPRKLHMVQVNMTAYGVAFRAGTGVNGPGLYATNDSSPLETGAGLRQLYAWGLYGYCAYINPDGPSQGNCSNQTVGYGFKPYDVILADVPEGYLAYSQRLIPDATAFKNSPYLYNLTRAGMYLLFVGTIAAFIALVTGVIKHKITFLLASFFSIIATLFILIGASIWTSAINHAQTVNKGVVGIDRSTPLGIELSSGSALYLFWAAFVLLLISTLPYSISCWSFLKR